MVISIFILILFTSGCVSDSIVPGIDPNPTVNPDNSTVSYVKVSASSSTIKINQSLQFVVKGYNSDDEWVILDKSKIKYWVWSVQGQCYVCVKPYVTLTPQSSSLTTTFTSGVTGTFFIGASYQETEPSYTEIKVI